MHKQIIHIVPRNEIHIASEDCHCNPIPHEQCVECIDNPGKDCFICDGRGFVAIDFVDSTHDKIVYHHNKNNDPNNHEGMWVVYSQYVEIMESWR